MKLKKDDTVVVIAGKDKGKVGKILRIFPNLNRVTVEGVNMVKKHQKPTQANPEGGILEFEGKIHASNVMLYLENKAVRVGYKFVEEDGKKVKKRIAKKSGALIG